MRSLSASTARERPDEDGDGRFGGAAKEIDDPGSGSDRDYAALRGVAPTNREGRQAHTLETGSGFLSSGLGCNGACGAAASRTLVTSAGRFALSSVSGAPTLAGVERRWYRERSFSVVSPPTGAENWRFIAGPGLVARPAAKLSISFSKVAGVRS